MHAYAGEHSREARLGATECSNHAHQRRCGNDATAQHSVSAIALRYCLGIIVSRCGAERSLLAALSSGLCEGNPTSTRSIIMSNPMNSAN